MSLQTCMTFFYETSSFFPYSESVILGLTIIIWTKIDFLLLYSTEETFKMTWMWVNDDRIFIFVWTIQKVNIMSITGHGFGINHLAMIWQPNGKICLCFTHFLQIKWCLIFFQIANFHPFFFAVSDKSAWFSWCFLQGNSAPLFSNSRENMRTLINLICNSEQRSPWSIYNPSEPALQWPQSVISCEYPFRNVLRPLLLLQ